MTKEKRPGAAQRADAVDRLAHQQTAALEASLDGVAILDNEGRYIFLNDAHARLYGYESAHELTGKSYRDHYSGAELKRLNDVILPEFWRTGAWRGELAGRTRDGATFPQELSLSRVKGEAAGSHGFVVIARDITERKRAELEHARLLELEKAARVQAEAASRAKDEFLAVVSHELRTPMTAILGWTWLLRSGDVAPGELNKALEVIERNMKLQAQIIEDLLDVSSIVTGKLHLQTRPLQLSHVVRAAVDTVRSLAEAKRVALEIDVADDPTVMGDAHRLQQVFWNLLNNAVKFNTEGGSVRVTLGLEGGCAAVRVADTGQGIEPALLPELFEPFKQGEESLTRQFRGLGLGLAIVRHLIELHSGSVAAASAGLGQGSMFSVLLPTYLGAPRQGEAKSPARGGSAPAAASLPGSLNGLKILVVDDEPDTLAMLSELLTFCGAAVSSAVSAKEGFAELRRSKPDLIVSDLAMPEEDGYSFIKRVRALVPEGRRVKALALSARARSEDRAMAISSGFDSYLSKPVEPANLVASLLSIAER